MIVLVDDATEERHHHRAALGHILLERLSRRVAHQVEGWPKHQPVATQIAAEVLCSKWVQSDDTTVEVQDRGCNPAYPRGHIWVYRGEDGSAFYDFTWKRNSEGPLRILRQYQGYLQADAAPAYDDVYAQLPIVEVGCWAHARRRFKEALRTSPKVTARTMNSTMK